MKPVHAHSIGLAGGLLVALAVPIAVAAVQARPRAFDPALLESGDLIRYRALSPADFRAAEPPSEMIDVHGRLGAATCVFLATDPAAAIRTRTSGNSQESRVVSAQVVGLGFLAYMDRRCSWWNPSPLELPAEYILQHEQIHFALFEIAARRLNARVDEVSAAMTTVAASVEEAVAHIDGRIDAEMRRALDEVMARGNEFDRETSRTYRRDRQAWWWARVSDELEALAEGS